MHNILFLSDTYYPDSRASTIIVKNLAEELVRKNNNVWVCPLRFANPAFTGAPEVHNNVRIINIADNAFNSFAKKIVGKFANIRWAKIYQHEEEYALQYNYALYLGRYVKKYKIDTIVSFSLPEGIHICANMIAKSFKRIKWIPISLDPYAKNQVISAELRSERDYVEKQLFARADKIMMLSQAVNDYKNEAFVDKIEFFELPGIRNLSCEGKKTSTADVYDTNFINCVYTGTFFWDIRNPEFMFSLFQQLMPMNIKIHVYGGCLGGFPSEYMHNKMSEFQGKLVYHDRVSHDVTLRAMEQADVLISLGNTTSNQCPSKVFDYISMCKPVIHFRKKEDCAASSYFEHYPLACIINEYEGLSKSNVEKVKSFLLNCGNMKISYNDVFNLFSGCTIEKMADILINIIKEESEK